MWTVLAAAVGLALVALAVPVVMVCWGAAAMQDAQEHVHDGRPWW